jgi:hypothetical protein
MIETYRRSQYVHNIHIYRKRLRNVCLTSCAIDIEMYTEGVEK